MVLPRWRTFAMCLLASSMAWAGPWQPILKDGLHDPAEPGSAQLQNPADALGHLPPDTAGNKVDWNKALLGKHSFLGGIHAADCGTVVQVGLFGDIP